MDFIDERSLDFSPRYYFFNKIRHEHEVQMFGFYSNKNTFLLPHYSHPEASKRVLAALLFCGFSVFLQNKKIKEGKTYCPSSSETSSVSSPKSSDSSP